MQGACPLRVYGTENRVVERSRGTTFCNGALPMLVKEDTVYELSPPVPATAILVDLRNFTPNLNAAGEDERGINLYCYFLSQFYALCIDACLVALPPSLRERPPLHISSTGDGVLIIFTHDLHARHGFLATIILHMVLGAKCNKYNADPQHAGSPPTSFGIGVDSGEVCRIRAFPPGEDPFPIVDTSIGSCINVAARAEAATKAFAHIRTIISNNTNELLCQHLFGESYTALGERSGDRTLADDIRLALYDQMLELNRKLCLDFIHYHSLKGVDRPVALFRIAGLRLSLSNPRFEELIAKLTESEQHLAEVRGFLTRTAHSEAKPSTGRVVEAQVE